MKVPVKFTSDQVFAIYVAARGVGGADFQAARRIVREIKNLPEFVRDSQYIGIVPDRDIFLHLRKSDFGRVWEWCKETHIKKNMTVGQFDTLGDIAAALGYSEDFNAIDEKMAPENEAQEAE